MKREKGKARRIINTLMPLTGVAAAVKALRLKYPDWEEAVEEYKRQKDEQGHG